MEKPNETGYINCVILPPVGHVASLPNSDEQAFRKLEAYATLLPPHFTL
jgi:hypothetical protein